ncbi:MAG: type II secretion system F family protein [Candidatus Bilamarchaeaceae archaeon]
MEQKNEKGFFYPLAEYLSHRSYDMKNKLKLAGIQKSPVEYTEDNIKKSIFLSLVLLIFSALVFFIVKIDYVFLIPLALVWPIAAYNYLMLYPDALIEKRKRELDYEILFAGRHILIALRSGLPLFDTFVSASTGYGQVSVEIKKIVDKIIVGVPATQAIREVAQEVPSKYFSRVMMQIANSLSSGADVGSSLEAVLEQVSKEQVVQLKEYSQKLTPTVMFYMLFGIIVPSIGVVLASAFVSVFTAGKTTGYGSATLIPVFLIIVIIQFLFLGIIESTRPKYLL